MEQFTVTFSMFISAALSIAASLFMGGFWVWLQRQSKEREQKEAAIHAEFASIHAEMAQRRDKIHTIEMALQATIRREEMERIYARMEDIRKELGEDVRSQMSVLTSTLTVLLQRNQRESK